MLSPFFTLIFFFGLFSFLITSSSWVSLLCHIVFHWTSSTIRVATIFQFLSFAASPAAPKEHNCDHNHAKDWHRSTSNYDWAEKFLFLLLLSHLLIIKGILLLLVYEYLTSFSIILIVKTILIVHRVILFFDFIIQLFDLFQYLIDQGLLIFFRDFISFLLFLSINWICSTRVFITWIFVIGHDVWTIYVFIWNEWFLDIGFIFTKR